MLSYPTLYNTPLFENINKLLFFYFLFPSTLVGEQLVITYINKRLLELDVKSIIRKGNDGILSTAHILCAFSMKFKKRNLQNEEETFQSSKAVKQSLQAQAVTQNTCHSKYSK